MATCVRIVNVKFGNTLTPIQIETGERVQGYVMIDPAATDFGTCAYVLETGPEYSGWSQLLAMTPNDALVYSSAIAFVWAVAWGIKAVIKTLNTERNEDD